MVKLYVEGGGNQNPNLAVQCCKGFTKFLEKAGLAGYLPRIVVCGGRREAYNDFRIACKNKQTAFLLLDSEMPVEQAPENSDPWKIIRSREGSGGDKPDGGMLTPSGATPEHLHLMVQCMEAWFLADPDALKRFFGKGFNEKSLPPAINIEAITKEKVYGGLKKAAKKTPKSEYRKGGHSFEILGRIDPQKVIAASPWAERFIAGLKEKMGIV